jgi:hypothetical protein
MVERRKRAVTPVGGSGGRRARRAAVCIILGLALTVAVSACGGGSSSSSSEGAANPDLRVAVAFLPTSADSSYTFEFADWVSIEKELGYSPHALSSADAQQAFVKKVDHLSAATPAGNVSYDLSPPGTGNVWSLDDVLWDAQEFPIRGGAPIAITAFRSGSVITRVEKRLTKCGFHSRAVGGLSLYTTKGNGLNCVSPTGAGIPVPYVVYAFDATHPLVLQSVSSAAVTAAIANRTRGTSSHVLSSILSNLGDVSQVAVALGPQFCSELSAPLFLAGRNATPRTVTRAEHVFPDTTRYLGFGFGYRYASHALSGRLAFLYPSQTVARSDLRPRERMLRNGIAFSANEPYSRLFQVGSGHAQGNATIYPVRQPGNAPLRLGVALDQLDIGFARC